MIDTLIQQFHANTALELAAVAFALLYLALAIRENVLCWPAALVSTAIYLWIFWDVHLVMESALQVFYIAMAIYGWWQWTHGPAAGGGLPVTRWRARTHAAAIATVALLTFATGLALQDTSARLPYVDAFTTWAAVVTTWMVARKVLENWIYWFVIDTVSIFLYLDRGLYFTSALFVAYIVMIVFGWFSWLRSYENELEPAGTGALR